MSADVPTSSAATPELTDRTGVEQGLPASWARALAVDPSGRAVVALADEGGTVGLARVGATVETLPSPPGQVQALAVDTAGTIWIGTDHGLLESTGSTWTPRIAGPVSGIVRSGDDLWAWGEGGVAVVTAGFAASVPVAEGCKHPIALVPGESVWLVCRTGVRVGDASGLVERSLDGTDLVGPPGAADEGSAPPVWLMGAAAGPGGVLITGRRERLVLLGRDSAETVAVGRFVQVASDGAAAVAIGEGGEVVRWTREAGRQILWTEKGSVDHPLVDAQGNLFIVRQPRAAAHSVERRPPPWIEADRVWGLAIGDSLSPGVSAMVSDGSGGVWLSTNRGVWHLH